MQKDSIKVRELAMKIFEGIALQAATQKKAKQERAQYILSSLSAGTEHLKSETKFPSGLPSSFLPDTPHFTVAARLSSSGSVFCLAYDKYPIHTN